MLIFLTGFMGSGKSTMLQKLHESLKGEELSKDFLSLGPWVIEDLDQMVFEQFGQGEGDIGELIRKVGLETFRTYESEVLGRLLMEQSGDDAPNHVVALGGGTLGEREYHPNLERLYEFGGGDVYVVWLDTPFEECWRRIREDKSRPLVELGESGAKALYERRCPVYRRADVVLNRDQQEQMQRLEDLVFLFKRP